MRILALVTDAFGGYGGIAEYNRKLLTAMAANDLVESIVVLPRLGPATVSSLPSKIEQHQAVPSRLSYSLRAMLAMGSRPDIVFSGHLYHGPLAAFIARTRGAKLISQVHGIELWSPIAAAHRRALERSELVLAVSRNSHDLLITKVPIAGERAVVINNTLGEEFAPGDRVGARTKFFVAPQEIAVLTVARLDADGYKGHDRVIPLIAEARRQGLPAIYLIAGTGEDQPRLERLARECGVEGQVRFLGAVSADDLPDLYRAADLFALPSTGEGFGIATIEAMACGTPAIGLAIGGAPDALGDGELGTCVAPDDFPAAFAAALRNCGTRDPTLPDRVRARFGWPVFREQVDQQLAALHGMRTAR